ncbi:hypothetical protein J6590_004618 [Homalodisca vitripennis]|nr:hypothetical protein J6590_004618 [Homalodisca vitripennis]
MFGQFSHRAAPWCGDGGQSTDNPVSEQSEKKKRSGAIQEQDVRLGDKRPGVCCPIVGTLQVIVATLRDCRAVRAICAWFTASEICGPLLLATFPHPLSTVCFIFGSKKVPEAENRPNSGFHVGTR